MSHGCMMNTKAYKYTRVYCPKTKCEATISGHGLQYFIIMYAVVIASQGQRRNEVTFDNEYLFGFHYFLLESSGVNLGLNQQTK